MPAITPHLWFATQAVEAAELYTSVFTNSEITHHSVIRDTPSGDCDIVGFTVMGYQFMAISAGPLFQLNPSISFHARFSTTDEVEAIWARLAEGGVALMELGEYPFSQRYGWMQDRYGVSWQVIHTPEPFEQAVVPAMMFTQGVCGKAEEAAEFYASIFPHSRTSVVARYGSGDEPEREGDVQYAQLVLDGQEFVVMDSAQANNFAFNEAVSFIVICRDQTEIDHYWDSLSAVPQAEQCGWIKDKYGVSWQIVPENMEELMAVRPEKTTPAMLQMKKIVIADLIAAGEADDETS